MIKKIYKFYFSFKFLQIFGHQNLGSVFGSVSGSALTKNAGSGFAWIRMKTNADPQHCLQERPPASGSEKIELLCEFFLFSFSEFYIQQIPGNRGQKRRVGPHRAALPRNTATNGSLKKILYFYTRRLIDMQKIFYLYQFL